MILLITTQTAAFEISKQVVAYYKIADFGIQGDAIPRTLATAAGQILVSTGADTWVVLDAPVANNQVLVSDLTLPEKWKIGSLTSGGGVIQLTNKDGSTASAGSCVIADLGFDEAFEGTTTPFHLGVIGVTGEEIVNDATGNVVIAGLTDTLVAGNVSRGEWLISSSTKWRAKSAGFDKPLYGGVIGYALTAYAGGGNGTVSAVVMPEPRHLTTAGTAWALGGYNTVAVTNGQKFTIASATWANVAGAALGTAYAGNCGLAYGSTAGYSIGGGTDYGGTGPVVTAYKMPFATETTATASSANLPTATALLRVGNNGSDRGYVSGGYTGAASANVYKLTYATDTMSAALGTTLAAARWTCVGMSNGTTGYVQAGNTGGGTGVSDKITFASDTVADNNAGDVTAAIDYEAFCFAASNGYMASKQGATNLSHKVVLSTGVSGTVTSTLPADQAHASGVTNGSSLGWFSGDDASPFSVSHKFTQATETYAADAGAVMATGKQGAAQFNNGAY